ncbi:hypothetical protein G6672_02755 [Polynucleobacter paneuropaeus]|nr:hypothetical protein [Polynucleobacter paneuropaeus]
MLKIKKLIIAALLGIFPIIGFAETKEVKTPGQLCAKASGLSKGFAEYVASKMRVAMSSVSLIRASQDSYGSCSITVDTAKGPQSCVGATLYTDGKGDYWIGGSCF